MLLSKEIRRWPHIVHQSTQREWADKVAKLEAVAEAARIQNKNWHSPIVTKALEALDAED